MAAAPDSALSHKRTLSNPGDVHLPAVHTPTVADFVRLYGGTHVIEKILIANNGIAVNCLNMLVFLPTIGREVYPVHSQMGISTISKRACHQGVWVA